MRRLSIQPVEKGRDQKSHPSEGEDRKFLGSCHCNGSQSEFFCEREEIWQFYALNVEED